MIILSAHNLLFCSTLLAFNPLYRSLEFDFFSVRRSWLMNIVLYGLGAIC